MISWSISSPATRIEVLTTIPPSAITATAVVPPPMSTIMQPCGSITGSPAPIAAAIGSSTRKAAPARALRLRADGEDLLGDLVDRDDRGLVDDDAAAADHDQGVRRPQVDAEVVRKCAKKSGQRVKQGASLRNGFGPPANVCETHYRLVRRLCIEARRTKLRRFGKALRTS